MPKMQVYCTTEFPAFHFWSGAPDSHHFLRYLHRHIFKVKVTVCVEHEDRDVEFIKLKEDIALFCHRAYWNKVIGQTSCEMIAMDIRRNFLGYKISQIEVSEDGENGAVGIFERD